jgi:hypothetical protein
LKSLIIGLAIGGSLLLSGCGAGGLLGSPSGPSAATTSTVAQEATPVQAAPTQAAPAEVQQPLNPYGFRCADYTTPPAAQSQPLEEVVCNTNGVNVFSAPDGSPPPPNVRDRIPANTVVHVRCYVPSTAGMASVANMYLIDDTDWRGLYAPAEPFLNEGTSFRNGVPLCASGAE